MINIALPKGRMGNAVYARFAAMAGETDKTEIDIGRRLVFEDERLGLRYMMVKPADVTVYVEHGAADIGVAGADVVMENDPDVYELLDLNEGVCRLAVAAKNGWQDDISRPIRVATKYPNITRRYYMRQNRQTEIIKLNGSIELAPLLGLSDVILDIVETGQTLRENGLSVVSVVARSSARLIAGKSSYQFKKQEIDRIVREMGGQK